MAEEKFDLYQQELEARIKKSIDAPESSFGRVLKGISAFALVWVVGLGGINYALHNGPQERRYYDCEVASNAKPTGITSYVVYRRLENVATLNNSYKHVDFITQGNLFTADESYIDWNSDKKVDKIISDSKNLDRNSDYKDHQSEFDEADKFFAKYVEELSK